MVSGYRGNIWMTDTQVYTDAAIMGALAGMRSMSSPAIVSQFARSKLLPVGDSRIAFLNRSVTAKTLAVAAAAELVADKLPFLPKRTKAPSLIFRTISGGFGGAAICSAKKRPLLAGILIGAAGAIGATYGLYQLRRWAGQRLNVPDPVIAIAEDALVAGCGVLAYSVLRKDEAA
jgi:uncharacterized membrane protein